METPPRAWGRPCGDSGRVADGEKHPHERGEDQERLLHRDELMETPPRAWGRPCLFCRFRPGSRNTPTSVGKTAKEQAETGKIRNTPTSVGKTEVQVYGRGGTWKHPHERGEDSESPPTSIRKVETPPRAWGRHSTSAEKMRAVGNTPTSVGKTRGGHTIVYEA